jgi:beta-1,4-mannosyltransferase
LYIVPWNFKAKAIAKGRAMNHHIINKPVVPNKWYCFVDDDNLIMDDKFLYEIPVYEKEGRVAANGILLPRYSNNKITYIADFLRYFDDLTLFRFLTGVLQRPLNGFHGELMIVKGEILQKIGFDRRTITEDFAFARELDKYEHKVWQSRTVTSILSPHTIKEFIQQRNRWHKGISSDVWDGTLEMKLVAGVRSIDLFIAIIGSWVVFPLWFFMHIPLWLIAFNIIGGLYYWFVYIYGAIKLRNITPHWFLYIFLIPLYSVMEVVVPHYKSKESHFNVIRKSG